MATPKKKSTRSSSRAQVVPVRVVESQPRPLPAERLIVARPAVKRKRRPEGDRRLLMWTGVAVVAIAIFIVWLAFLPSTLSRGSGSDSLLSHLRGQLTEFFKRIQPFRPTADQTNVGNSELDQLRNDIFPTVTEQQFSTFPEKTNVNSSPPTTNANLSAP